MEKIVIESVFWEILSEISKIRDFSHGSMRFGQIIGNALPSQHANDPYYVSDADMLSSLREYRASIESARG